MCIRNLCVCLRACRRANKAVFRHLQGTYLIRPFKGPLAFPLAFPWTPWKYPQLVCLRVAVVYSVQSLITHAITLLSRQ